MNDNTDAWFFTIISFMAVGLGFLIGYIVFCQSHYNLSEYEWKCGDWQVVNDKPECKMYVPKEKE